jgi:hypothetical protein
LGSIQFAVRFREEQIARLAASGWPRCPSVAQAVSDAGLTAVTAQFLADAFSVTQWKAAERATAALSKHFKGARFAEEVDYGVLLVPNARKLDTRRAMRPVVRRDQLGRPAADVFDLRLPSGVLGINSSRDWTLVATVVGRYGIALGSYDDVVHAPAMAFTVEGRDTRTLMIRQIWGARVLQCGADPPDCEANDHWTFTLFPGEETVDGCAESGTVLKGKVRFRLGKPTRGIGSARVAPALVIP